MPRHLGGYILHEVVSSAVALIVVPLALQQGREPHQTGVDPYDAAVDARDSHVQPGVQRGEELKVFIVIHGTSPPRCERRRAAAQATSPCTTSSPASCMGRTALLRVPSMRSYPSP